MKKFITFILFLLFSFVTYPFNFSVMPTGFAIDLNKVSTHEIYITNNTSEPIRLETYFEADPAFGEKYNLNSNIVVFPKIIALKAGASQTIRFRVKPDSNMEKGEYKSYLTFREIVQEIKTASDDEKNLSTNLSTKLDMITEISISIYGQNGIPITKGSLSKVKFNYSGSNINISASSISEGNTSLKFYYSLTDLNSDIKSEGILGISARNGKKDFGISLATTPNMKGKKAKLVITDQDGKVHYDQVHTL